MLSKFKMAKTRSSNPKLIETGERESTRTFREDQIKASINQKLIETGERERLKELLRTKLIECGWHDQLKDYCKDDLVIEIIKQKGLEHITVDDLVREITPKGRASVPDDVKKELLHRIRAFLAENP